MECNEMLGEVRSQRRGTSGSGLLTTPSDGRARRGRGARGCAAARRRARGPDLSRPLQGNGMSCQRDGTACRVVSAKLRPRT